MGTPGHPALRRAAAIVAVAALALGAAATTLIASGTDLNPLGDGPSGAVPGGDSTPAAKDPGPAPSAVAPARAICDDAPRVCSAARALVAAASKGDQPALLALSEPLRSVSCNANPERQPACGAKPSADGYTTSAQAKAAALITREQFALELQATFPGRAYSVQSVGCYQPDRSARPACDLGFVVVLDDGARLTALLFAYGGGPEPRMFGVYHGGPADSEGELASGGATSLPGLFPTGRVGMTLFTQPWSQQPAAAD